MINTISNTKSKQLSVIFLDSYISGIEQSRVSFVDESQIFVGKTLKILTDENSQIIAVAHKDNIGWYLIFSEPLLLSNYTSFGYYYETFRLTLEEDNAHVTFTDIKQNLNAESDEYEDGNLINEGKTGIVSSKDKMLLESDVKYFKKTAYLPNTNNGVFVNVCNLTLPNNKLPFFVHRIVLYGEGFNIDFEISLETLNKAQSIVENYELKGKHIHFSDRFKGSSGFVNIERLYLSDQTSIISVSFKGDFFVDGVYVTNFDLSVYQYNSQNITYPIPPFLSDYTNTISIQNEGILGETLVVNEIPLGINVDSVTFNGIVYKEKKDEKAKVPDGTNLDLVIKEGVYYTDSVSNLVTIQNKPDIGSNDLVVFVMVVDKKATNGTQNALLTQRFFAYCVDNTDVEQPKHLLKEYTRYISNVGTFTLWVEILTSERQILATDVLEDVDHEFVTGLNKTNWDGAKAKIDALPWREKAPNIADLANVTNLGVGVKVFVEQTGTVWSYDGANWVDSIKASSFIKTDATDNDILLGAGGVITISDLKNQLITQTQKLILNHDGVVPFELDWNAHISTYGLVPNIDVYVQTSGMNYSQQAVPIDIAFLIVTDEESEYFGKTIANTITINTSNLPSIIVIS